MYKPIYQMLDIDMLMLQEGRIESVSCYKNYSIEQTHLVWERAKYMHHRVNVYIFCCTPTKIDIQLLVFGSVAFRIQST